MRKFFSAVLNVISVLMILFAVVVLMNVVMTKSGEVPNIAGFSMLRVMSGSMEPAIPTNSILLVQKKLPEEVQVGDVISFYSRDPMLDGAVNTHRVVEITKENEDIIFTTKGDANLIVDKYLTNGSDLIGVVIFFSAIIGTVVRLLSNPLIFVPLVLLPLAVLIIVNMIKAIRSTQELMRQEEEAAIREALEEARRKAAEKKNEE